MHSVIDTPTGLAHARTSSPRRASTAPASKDLQASLAAFPVPAAALDSTANVIAYSKAFADLFEGPPPGRPLEHLTQHVSHVLKEGTSALIRRFELMGRNESDLFDAHLIPGPHPSIVFALLNPSAKGVPAPNADRQSTPNGPVHSSTPSRPATQRRNVPFERLTWDAVNAAGVGVVLVRRDDTTTQCTGEVLRLLGLSTTEVPISTWVDQMQFDDLARRPVRTEQHPILRAMRGEYFQNQILSLIPPSNSVPRYISFSGRYLKDDPCFRAVLVLTDVTQHLRNQRDLETLMDVVAHDLQEPARLIRSYVDIIDEECASHLPDTPKKYMGFVTDSAKRLQLQLKDFLRLSRVSNALLTPTTLDLNAVLACALKSLAPKIEASQAVIRANELPPIKGDAKQLQQLFVELLDNAIKFQRPDAPPCVTICHDVEPGFLRVTFEDNGIGVDPKFRSAVFAMFGRLNPRSKFEGTGTGLTIARKIARRHGGDIGFSSRPGTGSVFWVKLPA